MKVRVDGMVIEVDGETCRCGAGCRVPLEGKPDHGDWPHMFWHVADDGWLERPHRHDPETDRRIPGPFPKFVVPSGRIPESEEPVHERSVCKRFRHDEHCIDEPHA